MFNCSYQSYPFPHSSLQKLTHIIILIDFSVFYQTIDNNDKSDVKSEVQLLYSSWNKGYRSSCMYLLKLPDLNLLLMNTMTESDEAQSIYNPPRSLIDRHKFDKLKTNAIPNQNH